MKSKTIAIIIILLVLTSCTSGKMISQYKSPETDFFQANKVLVVGIHADVERRAAYEKTMVEALEKKNITAVKSVDFFEKSFTENKKSISQLNEIENQLLGAGFDAVLFSKITGNESRVTLVDAYRNFTKNNSSFEDYYHSNQHVYTKEEKLNYQVYTTETSVYCICPTKERELIWTGVIEVVNGAKVKNNIQSYIKILFNNLQQNNVLIVE